jgi:hypothetical protein
MTDNDQEETARRMHAIAAELTAAGMDVQVHEIRGVLDVTASLHRPGSKAIDLTLDEDHYVQRCWWNPDDATPGQVAATIGRALSAITDTSWAVAG